MIDAYTWPTPNGHKVHIMLEECGLEPLLQDILAHVDAVSLQSCRLVSRLWYCLGPTSHFHSLGQNSHI